MGELSLFTDLFVCFADKDDDDDDDDGACVCDDI